MKIRQDKGLDECKMRGENLWLIADGNNAKVRSGIGMNIRRISTEGNTSRSVARNWIITGARIVTDFI